VTTALMWFITAGAFLPLIFSNLYDGCNPRRTPTKSSTIFVRRERSRGFFGTNP